MHRQQLASYLADYLAIDKLQDYCPNGLQVEGRAEIQRIVTGVTASMALIETALEVGADAIIVHHGYFWKNEPAVICGMKQRRIAALLKHDLNLFAYHLPLDVHPQVGNNVQLGLRLQLPDPQPLGAVQPSGLVYQSCLPEGISCQQLASRIEQQLQRPLTCMVPLQRPLQRIAWCTGGGQSFIEQAAAAGCDAFISGEVSEQTVHSAREQGLAFFAAGHHATERDGIRALGQHLAAQHGLEVQFIEIDNPA